MKNEEVVDITSGVVLTDGDEYNGGSFDGDSALFSGIPSDVSDNENTDVMPSGEQQELPGFDPDVNYEDQPDVKIQADDQGKKAGHSEAEILELIKLQEQRNAQLQDFVRQQSASSDQRMQALVEQLAKSVQTPDPLKDEPEGPPEISDEMWAENPTKAASLLQEYHAKQAELRFQRKFEEQRKSMEEEQALQRKTQEEEARKSQWIQFTQSQIPEVAQRGSAVNKKFLALHQSYSPEMLPYLQACTAKYNAIMEAQQKKMANPTANPVPASDQIRKQRASRAQATPNRSPKKVPLGNKMTDYDKQFVADLGLREEGLKMYKKLKGIK